MEETVRVSVVVNVFALICSESSLWQICQWHSCTIEASQHQALGHPRRHVCPRDHVQAIDRLGLPRLSHRSQYVEETKIVEG